MFGKMDFGQWRESGRDGHSFIEKADAEALLDGGEIEKRTGTHRRTPHGSSP